MWLKSENFLFFIFHFFFFAFCELRKKKDICADEEYDECKTCSSFTGTEVYGNAGYGRPCFEGLCNGLGSCGKKKKPKK